MTEQEWLACTDPTPMLEFLRDRASDRKFRLFACACCRRTWRLLNTDQNRRAVEAAERCADGLIGQHELALVRDATGYWWLGVGSGRERRSVLARTATELASYVSEHQAGKAAADVARTAVWLVCQVATKREDRNNAEAYKRRLQERDESKAVERMALASLLREVIRNPFRPSPPLPSTVLAWSDGTVRRIAQGIYQERRLPVGTLDATRLAILADALLDGGCEDEELIAHCREPGPHYRGCWAIDAILARE
jgi:hypothetical protein